jgi:hypothetical protein
LVDRKRGSFAIPTFALPLAAVAKFFSFSMRKIASSLVLTKAAPQPDRRKTVGMADKIVK